jgi:pimeloyl-ACP methyl ester carboxylesterase
MSGAIVVEAALKNPTRVIGVVGIDNFTIFGTLLSPEVKKDISYAYKALRTNYKTIALQYANQSLFAPSTDSMVRKRVINDFINVDSTIAVDILETNDKYPADEKVKSLKKTLYLINSSYHPTDTTGFEKLKVPFKLLYLGPTGHYPMIENPIKFNKALEQVIKQIGQSKN